GDMDTQIIAGLAPVAARPAPRAAFVVGYGSGVTARVLADVPGMQRVRVVEIEPAVLAMDSFFRHVNDNALARPNVSVIVDDARSALQIDPTRYDIVVSEPSNPWLAGVATLYTPEFFRVVRSRLADDGVFCQWVQLYHLPLPVVAGVVRNVRAATQAEDGTSPLLFARALAVRRGDPAGLRYLDAVRRAQPDEPFWTAYTAAILLGLGDTAFADSALARVLRSGESREALLLS